jgi:hypothetical protein
VGTRKGANFVARLVNRMVVNEQNFPERDRARVNSETSGTIFSSSFKVGIMIEMEFESVVLKRQTFNAQPAFGNPTAPQASTFNRWTPTIRDGVPAKP